MSLGHKVNENTVLCVYPSLVYRLKQQNPKNNSYLTITVWYLFSPRSEHWITRRWHWHLNGHLGASGLIGPVCTGTSGTSGRPDPGSSSIMKSRNPDWRNGRAQQAVTRSRERQADLMVLLAGSLKEQRTQFKGLGGYRSKIVSLNCVQTVLYNYVFLIECNYLKQSRRREDFKDGSGLEAKGRRT